jgi:hypothetical protein
MLSLAEVSLPDPGSPQAIGWFALVAAAALVILNQALTFWKEHVKEKPAPADTYATKVDHSELRERVTSVEGKIDSNYKTLDQKRSVSVANLHEALTAQTAALNSRIDDVPGRVIELLSKTKQLHGK